MTEFIDINTANMFPIFSIQ